MISARSALVVSLHPVAHAQTLSPGTVSCRSTAGAAGPGPGSSEALMQAVQQWAQQLRADLPAVQAAEQQLAQEVGWSGSVTMTAGDQSIPNAGEGVGEGGLSVMLVPVAALGIQLAMIDAEM